jgi:5-methylcytosine-specific restriction protein B
VAVYLRDDGPSASRSEVLAHVETILEPDEDELKERSKGQTVWENNLLWQTTNLVKAGWLTKDGKGTWTITPEGVTALDEFPDPAEYHRESTRRFNEWTKERDSDRRRAWLIRGSSVLGTNLVPYWLTDGFVSLAASQLRPLELDVTAEDIERAAAEDYSHLKASERRSKVEEIVAFVMRIHPGDIVVTTSGTEVFVGDVDGDWAYAPSDGGRSNLRRLVEWRNQDAPVAFSELPEPLPARLQSGSTILDLTADLTQIDGLTIPDADELADVDGGPARTARHEHLPIPGEELAEALLVGVEWLHELRDLLDERRQLILYGPPGTGKTFLARRVAADLVGPEQVRLVQFHPAYTYEDFFEGYRPAPGVVDGGISFELRPGPFRQLVTRAREHPDQAFVLIIDEINRANLAKVFGELYFLLEYRDQAVDLLYSSDEEGFTLPTNIYVIGTMNTADRSIALVDAAMRRRFAFVELSPDTEPTRSLLARWSARHELGDVAARLLVRLNQRIEDPDFRIGPSYFMRSTAPDAHDTNRLDRIWRTSILPLLQEHHYGEWESAKGRYRLSTLLAEVEPGAEDPAPPRQDPPVEQAAAES